MALQSGLAVWCYTAPTSSFYAPTKVDYSALVENLTFSSVAPGGFGQLSCTLRVATAILPRPELAMFSRIAVMGGGENGPYCVFLGEITDPELDMDDTNGEYFTIQALGLGNGLRDDPINISYSNQTPKAIINSQMTTNNRANFLPIDPDQSLIFPDNPVTTYSPSYMGSTFEDVLGDVVILAGDYMWGVWAHGWNTDTFGFPTAQLQVHLRDTSTLHYQASVADRDVFGWKITPSAERAYNHIRLGYNDPAHSGYGNVTAVDSRLTGTGGQGTAPFRRRSYMQDYSTTSTVTQSQAQSIANTQLALMKNVTNKIELTLRGVKNSNNNQIPLWAVQADRNIFVPELAPRAQQLALTPTATVNQFYIIEAEYQESSDGTVTLTLQCDNWFDYAQTRLARLELQAYSQSRNGTQKAAVQAIGSPYRSYAGNQQNTANASAIVGVGVGYGAVLAQAPTSITLSVDSSTNAASVGASFLNVYGFFLFWTATLAGNTLWQGKYQTVGNCILAVDEERGTFDHHCEVCGLVRTGLVIAHDLRVDFPHEGRRDPGASALAVACPRCGAVEAFNTALESSDEVEHHGNSGHRAGMAQLIRRLMRHPHMGLEVR